MGDRVNDRLKEKAGGESSAAWFIVGLILIVWDRGWAALFTLSSALFLLVGPIVAALTVGVLTYWIASRAAEHLARAYAAGKGVAGRYMGVKLLILGLNLLTPFWVYASFFWA
jgi:hypothetical protein